MLVAFVLESPFACIRNFGSLACSLVKSTIPDNKKSAEVERMANVSLQIFSRTLSSFKTYCAESDLLLGIGGITFIIDWEYSFLRASDVKSSGTSLGSFMSRLEFGKAMHAFHTSMCKQFWQSLLPHVRLTLGSILAQFIRSAIFGQDALDAVMITSLCCEWTIEVCQHLCLNPLEEQKLMNVLIRIDDLWPLWITLDSCNSQGKYMVKVEQAFSDEHVSENSTSLVIG